MKAFSQLFIGMSIALQMLACSSEQPNKAKALQLLKEINEIAERSRETSPTDDMMSKARRIGENRKNFPDSREELKNDAKSLGEFFARSNEEDEQIIEKYQELLKLGLVKPEADCVENSLKQTRDSIEKKKASISEFELFFDDDIKDKQTLDARTLPIRQKADSLDEEIVELGAWSKAHCPGR